MKRTPTPERAGIVIYAVTARAHQVRKRVCSLIDRYKTMGHIQVSYFFKHIPLLDVDTPRKKRASYVPMQNVCAREMNSATSALPIVSNDVLKSVWRPGTKISKRYSAAHWETPPCPPSHPPPLRIEGFDRREPHRPLYFSKLASLSLLLSSRGGFKWVFDTSTEGGFPRDLAAQLTSPIRRLFHQTREMAQRVFPAQCSGMPLQ